LDYDSDVQVGGKIASVGQRLIDASSRAIVKQSLEGLNEQIKALAAAPAPRVPPPAVPLTAASSASAEPSAAVDVPLAAEPAATAAAPAVAAPTPAVDPLPEGSPPAARSGDGGWFSERGPTHAAAALEAAPGAAAVRAAAPRQPARGPSQASFAFGVAKEVTKELFPLKKILIVVALLALAWLIFSALSGK
jgi:hypothetical protein